MLQVLQHFLLLSSLGLRIRRQCCIFRNIRSNMAHRRGEMLPFLQHFYRCGLVGRASVRFLYSRPRFPAQFDAESSLWRLSATDAVGWGVSWDAESLIRELSASISAQFDAESSFWRLSATDAVGWRLVGTASVRFLYSQLRFRLSLMLKVHFGDSQLQARLVGG
ncbi:hypothetical protein SAMN05518855_10176 [Paenibacillus sp. CF384]|nr:hypothetical protein SAMN05518855_10176 [Paenibacillus sp. CF384]